MHIVVVGASHSTAPLEFLERLSVPPGELDHLLFRLKAVIDEAFVLSTCNRTEVYAVTDDVPRDVDLVLGLLAERAGATPAELMPLTYVLQDLDAVTHAMRVASGLDSMVLGEDQIQAQVKRALAAARGGELLGTALDRLGAAALGCGKRVRAFTGIGQHSVSLESLGVRAALQQVNPRAGDRAVVLGSGSSAALVVKQLRDAGMTVTIVGRTHGAAADLATGSGSGCAPWERLPDTLVDARVVFCCTSAPHPVLTTDMLSRRLGAAPAMPLLCVDLGMPRDVDHGVAELPMVAVLALAELGEIAATHRRARARHVPAAEAVVEREVRRFAQWLESRDTAKLIAERRAHAEAVADAEVRRALARLPGASAHDRAVVAELARRLVRKLMHADTHELRLLPGGSGRSPSEEAVS